MSANAVPCYIVCALLHVHFVLCRLSRKSQLSIAVKQNKNTVVGRSIYTQKKRDMHCQHKQTNELIKTTLKKTLLDREHAN
jgi:hypothetical protein